MFTSRAEFRMLLRADNADQRLTQMGIELGCVGPERQESFSNKIERLNSLRDALSSVSLSPQEANAIGIQVKKDGKRRTAFDLLSFPNVSCSSFVGTDILGSDHDPETCAQIERDALYASYIERQNHDAAALRRDEALEIPRGFDFDALSSLSNELKSKLNLVRPASLAQAGKIDGMTPAALTLILGKIKNERAKAS